MHNIEQKIIPFLWFDNQAEEAAQFYASIFKNSEVGNISKRDKVNADATGQPEGSALSAEFTIEGHKFVGINGGPIFKLNPSISFIVSCPAKEDVDDLWKKLSDGGTPLMPLDSYPFSKRYGWIQDKYGVSWQLILPLIPEGQGNKRPTIVPSMMFTGDNCGKAEEAVNFYTSIFKDSKVGDINRYSAEQEPNKEGTIMYADFMIENQWFAVMDSALEHDFTFNEAISFLVNCDTQEEVDKFWDDLSAVPEAEQCGWIKDKYGASWQIVPTVLPELLNDPDSEKASRVMEAMLQMKKIDIDKLNEAYKG